MQKIFLLSFLLALSVMVTAQDEEANVRYGGMQQLGIAIEANAINAMPNLINGVRFGNWYTGIGVAYEIKTITWRNGINTMPVYADVRYYFFKKKWVFALADVGTNLLVGNEWMNIQQGGNVNKKIGHYANFGGGVKARLGRNTFYTFDVSYNFKQTRYDRMWEDGRGLIQEETNNFKQQRFLIRLGIEI